jgi:hypothetical protein
MFINSESSLLTQLQNAIGTGGVRHGVYWGLYFQQVVPSIGMQLADFGDLTAGGAFTNEQLVVWGNVFFNDQGQAEVHGADLNWLTTYPVSPALTAYGWLELDSTKTIVLRAEAFAVPYVFTRAYQQMSITPIDRVSN